MQKRGLLVALAVTLLLAVSGCGSTMPEPESTSQLTDTPLSTDTLAPPDTPVPTDTRQPTHTPTDTPEPTLTADERLLWAEIEERAEEFESELKLIELELEEESGSVLVRWSIQSRPGPGGEKDWARQDAGTIAFALAVGLEETSGDYSTVDMVGVADLVDDEGNTDHQVEVLRVRYSTDSFSHIAPMVHWGDFMEADPAYRWWEEIDRLTGDIIEAISHHRTVVTLEEESQRLFVEWCIRSPSGTENVRARQDAQKILVAVGQRIVDYGTLEMVGVADLLDDEGNTDYDVEVLRLIFSREVLDEVNWETYEDLAHPAPMHEWADIMEAHADYRWWGEG